MSWVQIIRMSIQQSRCTGAEAAGQSAGSGSGGLVSSLWGQQEEQVMWCAAGVTDLAGCYALSADNRANRRTVNMGVDPKHWLLSQHGHNTVYWYCVLSVQEHFQKLYKITMQKTETN